MTQPFVVSLKLVTDNSQGVRGIAEERQAMDALRVAFDRTAESAQASRVALDAAIGVRADASGTREALEVIQQQIRAEQQLEGQRLPSQISDVGRNQSLQRSAELGREAQQVANALAASDRALTMADVAAAAAAGRVAEAREQQAGALTKVAMASQQVVNARSASETTLVLPRAVLTLPPMATSSTGCARSLTRSTRSFGNIRTPCSTPAKRTPLERSARMNCRLPSTGSGRRRWPASRR